MAIGSWRDSRDFVRTIIEKLIIFKLPHPWTSSRLSRDFVEGRGQGPGQFDKKILGKGSSRLVSSRCETGDAAFDWSQRTDWLASLPFWGTDRLMNSVFGAWVHVDLDVGSL